jgi:hypothetical protein
MGGKRAAIDAALFGARLRSHRVLLVIGGFVRGNGLLDIFERQKQLVRIKLLRTPPELRALQLAQQVPQPINLRKRLIPLGDRGVTLGTRCRKERMQPLRYR